jgi:hypothetical protein
MQNVVALSHPQAQTITISHVCETFCLKLKKIKNESTPTPLPVQFSWNHRATYMEWYRLTKENGTVTEGSL